MLGFDELGLLLGFEELGKYELVIIFKRSERVEKKGRENRVRKVVVEEEEDITTIKY